MSPILYNVLIFAAFAVSMLLKDIVYTVETKADAKGNTIIAAIADPMGDGLASLTSIFTVVLIAAGLSKGAEVAQVAGNMAGGFIGVFAGSYVSALLDKLIAGYHRHPKVSRFQPILSHLRRTHPHG